MARRRVPILHRVSNLIKTSVFMAKMRKPVIQKLISLKKTRKIKRDKLVKHYNYGFLHREFEFSPSCSPLIQYPKKLFKHTSSRNNQHSILFLFGCLGGLKGGEGTELDHGLAMESFAAIGGKCPEPLDWGDDQEDSIDQRAERFIEKFYREIRKQRQESSWPY